MATKTVTATFRIEEVAFRDLQEDAKKQKVSVNTLVNQLFLSYSQYDRLMKRFQIMKIPSSTFKTILDGSTDEAVIAAAKTAGESIAKNFVISKLGSFTLENVLEGFRTSASYINAFEYSEFLAPGKITITLTHNLGAKGTLFLKEWVQCQCALLHKTPKFMTDDGSVTFEL
jgi:lambda repressor-like predicted transcriptional regulator